MLGDHLSKSVIKHLFNIVNPLGGNLVYCCGGASLQNSIGSCNLFINLLNGSIMLHDLCKNYMLLTVILNYIDS